MMTLRIQSTFFLLLLCTVLQAQPVTFVSSGSVEYTKSVNMYAVMSRIYGAASQEFMTRYKNANPQFLTVQSKLSFTRDKTLFNSFSPESMMAQNNTVYTDVAAKLIVAEKSILGESFLLKDSVRRIRWKITDEIRDIAGYPCRRANAVIMDSIYVVAFFTTDIPVSGGPESFAGLPGMILQVSLPHENITWLATKVTVMAVPALNPPVKGKPVTGKELHSIVVPALQRYGNSKYDYLKALLL
jgi:GLPGLI family protein